MTTRLPLMSGLAYIADSPPQKYGGFHPNAIATAKEALAEIRRLRSDLRRAKELLRSLPLPNAHGYVQLREEWVRDVDEILKR